MSKRAKEDAKKNAQTLMQSIMNPINNPADKKNDMLPLDSLVPYSNHPFKLYEGERFTDMVESIKANGIIMPVIVRPLADETYEILSGHNRVAAAKSAELETVPAIIREDLSDDEALLIVTETNLIQRSFADLSHSERAAVLAIHNDAIKNQGKRTDLMIEIENLLANSENISNHAEFETKAQIALKLQSRDKVAQKYDLSKDTVARYLRIYNKLNKLFNELLDSGELPFIAAFEISYLSEKDQYDLYNILNNNQKFKIDIKKAKILREYSANNQLSPNFIADILAGFTIKKKNRASLPVQSVKIGGKILSKYFKPEQKPEEIQNEIIKAIEYYMARDNNN